MSSTNLELISSDSMLTPPSLLYNGYRVFSGDKERPGRDADLSPSSSAVVKKGRAILLLPMGRTACTEPQCLYKGALYLFFLTMLASRMRYQEHSYNFSGGNSAEMSKVTYESNLHVLLS